jgi:hypothetical protein
VTEWMQGRRVAARWGGVLLAGIPVLIAGCHSGHQSGVVLAGLASVTQPKTTSLGPNHLVAEGTATIRATCGQQSFENARNGLIVSQTGLHEDVFALRSGTSYASIVFNLDDALLLEDVLRNELKENQQPIEQWKCVQQFEGYLETLTDPMVEQDKLAKELDATAFKDSTREAQEELRREKENEALAPKN